MNSYHSKTLKATTFLWSTLGSWEWRCHCILLSKIGVISLKVFFSLFLGFIFPEDGDVCVGRKEKELHD